MGRVFLSPAAKIGTEAICIWMMDRLHLPDPHAGRPCTGLGCDPSELVAKARGRA